MVPLRELYDRLAAPVPDDRYCFAALPIPAAPLHRLAKDGNDSPCLLIAATGAPRRERSTPIRLQHLHVDFDLRCRIAMQGSESEGWFTVLRCSVVEAGTQGHFLNVADALISALGPEPTPAHVQEIISAFVEIFRAATRPAKKTLHGLWAELFVLAEATNPTFLAETWHASPEDRYDFSLGAQRIEVKSTTTRIREHHFSLEQAYPPPESRVIVASLMTEASEGGPTIAGLLDRAAGRITSPALVSRLYQLAYETLGEHWHDATEVSMDAKLARASLRFIDMACVPKPMLPPPEVTKVVFCADLTNTLALTVAALSDAGGLFAAAVTGSAREA